MQNLYKIVANSDVSRFLPELELDFLQTLKASRAMLLLNDGAKRNRLLYLKIMYTK